MRAWLEATAERVLGVKELKDAIEKERRDLEVLEAELADGLKTKAGLALQLERMRFDEEN